MQSFRGYSDVSAMHCDYATNIAAFLHQHPQRSLPLRKVYRILDMYEKWWNFIGRYRADPFARYVLHYIAERAFWSGVRDCEYVAKLLEFIYATDGHFGFFLCPESCFLSEGSSPCDYHFASFLLNQAYRARVTVSGRRVVDLEVFFRSIWLHPCEMAVVSESPATLKLLLQYGALTTCENMSLQKFRTYPAAGNILVITLCIMKTILDIHRAETQDQEARADSQRLTSLVHCARLMMRVSPQYERAMMRQLSMEFPGFSNAEEAVKWVAENGVPELGFRTFSPMSLKHACRLSTRVVLHNNWQLPRGIERLPIPQTLKDFVNLDSD